MPHRHIAPGTTIQTKAIYGLAFGALVILACSTRDSRSDCDTDTDAGGEPCAKEQGQEPQPTMDAAGGEAGADGIREDAAGSGDAQVEPDAGATRMDASSTDASQPDDRPDASPPGAGSPEPTEVTHAQLCPGASPSAGVHAPPAGAQPTRLNPFYEHLESTIATAADFGLRDLDVVEIVENQPQPWLHSFEVPSDLSSYSYSEDVRVMWARVAGLRLRRSHGHSHGGVWFHWAASRNLPRNRARAA